MVADPLKAAFQFITPVTGFITPAAAGNTEYTIDVLLGCCRRIGLIYCILTYCYCSGGKDMWLLMVGLTVTSLSAVVVVHSPVEVAVIVAVPKKAASQSITPLTASITPAPAGDTE